MKEQKRLKYFYPDDLMAKVRSFAEEEKISISAVMRSCLQDGVELRLVRQHARKQGHNDAHLLWGAAYLLEDFRKRIRESE